jgi:hypothetical protein
LREAVARQLQPDGHGLGMARLVPQGDPLPHQKRRRWKEEVVDTQGFGAIVAPGFPHDAQELGQMRRLNFVIDGHFAAVGGPQAHRRRHFEAAVLLPHLSEHVDHKLTVAVALY